MGIFRRQRGGEFAGDEGFAAERERMVMEQLRGRGIRDPRVLEAMRSIPRHEFVPPELAHRAYEDGPLPIGGGQTISQPYIVALMSELLELEGKERVLEVGAGCGYQSAILSRLGGQVCAVELDPSLCEMAWRNLERIGAHNVDLRQGNGFEPWPGGGSFDAIVVACAPGEVPPVLVDQLAPGGRLVIPVGPPGQVQELHRYRLTGDGRLTDEAEGGVRFVPMRGSRPLS